MKLSSYQRHKLLSQGKVLAYKDINEQFRRLTKHKLVSALKVTYKLDDVDIENRKETIDFLLDLLNQYLFYHQGKFEHQESGDYDYFIEASVDIKGIDKDIEQSFEELDNLLRK